MHLSCNVVAIHELPLHIKAFSTTDVFKKTKLLRFFENDIHACIVFVVGAGLKPATTQRGKNYFY